MRVVIGGASGMIGTAVRAVLAERGDEVVRLVRRRPVDASEVQWDPASGHLDAGALRGADAVVSLSGAPISQIPWTRTRRERILQSRQNATTAITSALNALASAGERVPKLVSGSAVGYYGSRPGERLDEAAGRGTGFLADVVEQWEAAALAAPREARTVLARTGTVLGPEGALVPLRRLAAFGLSGPLGSGRQQWPWIGVWDEARAIAHLTASALTGPVNLVSPQPATAADVVRELAHQLHRPYWMPAPAFAIAGALGDAGRELLLSDQLVVPEALERDGFAFVQPALADAIAAALA